MQVVDAHPSWLPRALTVALSMALFVAIGVYKRHHYEGDDPIFAHNFYTACKWAAITCCVVAGPVTGDVANTAFERILGTVVGGMTGFVVRCVGEAVNTSYEWLMYGIAAGAIGCMGIWLGEVLDLGTSAKLFTITFLLVFAGGKNPAGAFVVMVTRTIGITVGVAVTLFFTITLLPSSAHKNIDRNIARALDELRSLHSLCWLPLVDTKVLRPADDAVAEKDDASDASGGGGGGGNDKLLEGEAEEIVAALVAGSMDKNGIVKSSANCMVAIYAALDAVERSLPAAAREIFVGRCFGTSYYVPRLFASLLCLGRRRVFPKDETGRVCDALRAVARVQLSLNNLFEDGLNEIMVEVMVERFPVALVPRLVQSAANVVEDCAASYPDETSISIQGWQRLNTLVHTLISISGFQRRRIQQQYLQYKRQAARWRANLRETSTLYRDSKCSTVEEKAQGGWARLRSWARRPGSGGADVQHAANESVGAPLMPSQEDSGPLLSQSTDAVSAAGGSLSVRLQQEPSFDSPFGGETSHRSKASTGSGSARPVAHSRAMHVVAGPDALDDIEGDGESDEEQEVGNWVGGPQDIEEMGAAAAAAAAEALKQMSAEAGASAASELQDRAGLPSGDVTAEFEQEGSLDDSEDADGQDHSADDTAVLAAAEAIADPNTTAAGAKQGPAGSHVKGNPSRGWPGALAMQGYNEDAAPRGGGSGRPAGVPRVDTQEMRLFPNTPEGHYAEITYYTFQFHMQELTEAMQDMQAAVAALLVRLPSNKARLTLQALQDSQVLLDRSTLSGDMA